MTKQRTIVSGLILLTVVAVIEAQYREAPSGKCQEVGEPYWGQPSCVDTGEIADRLCAAVEDCPAATDCCHVLSRKYRCTKIRWQRREPQGNSFGPCPAIQVGSSQYDDWRRIGTPECHPCAVPPP